MSGKIRKEEQHPSADAPSKAEATPLLRNSDKEDGSKSQNPINLQRLDADIEKDDQQPLLTPSPVPLADAPNTIREARDSKKRKGRLGDDLVLFEDFWDVKNGWMKFWNPKLTFHQLTVRERDDSLFCFDAFRAFAFLWVSNSHVQEAFTLAYDETSFTNWMLKQNAAIAVNSSNGVTVFFVVSGFLNLMVATSIARRLKDKIFSFRAAGTFMFRRFMHLGPNLYIAIIIALVVGCSSGLATLDFNFCSPCKKTWWLNYIFVADFNGLWSGDSMCFNSTWTVSAQMQMYVGLLWLKAIYYSQPFYAFLISLVLIAFVLVLRVKLLLAYGSSAAFYANYVYLPSYTRMEAYLVGMILWMIYEQVLRPMRTRSYVESADRPTLARDGLAEEIDAKPTSNSTTSVPSDSNNVTVDGDVNVKKNSADIYSQIETVLTDYIVTPTVSHCQRVYRRYACAIKYGSWRLLVSLAVVWPLAIYFTIVAFIAIVAYPDSYWWSEVFFPDLVASDASISETTKYQYIVSSYLIFVSGVGAASLLFFALEGSLYPIKWFFSWWIWYPIGMLSYTGYLLSILTTYTFFATMSYYHNNVSLTWSTENAMAKYVGYYWLLVLINLSLAAVMTFASERPMMNLSKALDI